MTHRRDGAAHDGVAVEGARRASPPRRTPRRAARSLAGPVAFAALVAAAATLVAPAPPAAATCFIDCRVEPRYDDCASPAVAGLWPADTPLSIVARCRTCCSPPGGPLVCEDTPVGEPETTLTLRVAEGEEDLPGSFVPLHLECEGERLRLFDAGPLAPGRFWIMRGPGEIVLELAVAEGPTPSPTPSPTATPGPSPTPTLAPGASRLWLPLAIRR